MRGTRRTGRGGPVLVAVAAGAAIAGVAVAMPALGGPSITRQITQLTKREKALEKKVQAIAARPVIAGAPGVQGPKGDAGPKGDPGPAATLAVATGFAPSGTLGTAAATVVTATVPHGGSFLVQANAIVTNTGAGTTLVTCDLVFAPTTEVLDTASVRLGAAGGLDTQTIDLAGALTAGSAGLTRLDCGASATGVNVTDADMAALG